MIAADLPPSSSVTGRSRAPESSPMRRPAATEPVNAILSTSAWVASMSSGAPAGTEPTTSSECGEMTSMRSVVAGCTQLPPTKNSSNVTTLLALICTSLGWDPGRRGRRTPVRHDIISE
jgi:hypothetical protein